MTRITDMSHQLSKSFDPAEVQRLAGECWERERLFHAEPTDPGEPFSVVIPPPNVTGALHLGHALNNTLQDIVVRWQRMRGRNAVWLPGTDHAGIATQTVVEKRVLKEEGKRRTDFKREEFVAKIQAWKDEYERRILAQLKAMGASCDFDRTAFTMDDARAKAVREAFFRFFKDGLIYRGKRLVNWDPVTQTALADDEVEDQEVDGFFYYLRYPLEDGSGHITVATTRPETMLGDTAVALNPKDPRAEHYRGKKVRLPIVNRVIPIIEDDYVVLPISLGGHPDDPKAQFATGFLKVTPAHDPNDWDIGQRHGLPVINVMAPDASISLDHGWLAAEPDARGRADPFLAEHLLGKGRDEARTAVVHWFRDNGLLEDTKPYRHSVGHSYRSHVPIEPYLSDQWYLKVTDPRMAQAANAALVAEQKGGASGGAGVSLATAQPQDPRGQHARATLRFHPARYAKMFESWHDNIRDWCISRQLWWGHRIPVWRRPTRYIGSIDAALPALQRLVALQRAGKIWLQLRGERVDATPQRIDDETLGALHVAVAPDYDEDPDVRSALQAIGAEQDPDVLDTWFSSALWPLSTLGWPDDTPELARWNPTNLLSTAREIITLWVSRMVMMNLYLRGCVPFTDVLIHPVIQDGEGRRMSKSLGNGVDPLDIIQTYGADALRYTLATMATQTQDVRLPVERDPQTGHNTSPKFDLGRSFCVKLWNAARFVLMQLEGDGATERPTEAPVDELKWTMADRWIVSRFNRTVAEVNAALGEYRFDNYAKAIYDFFWRDFCDWYVEAAKPQMRNPDQRGQTSIILASVLDGILRLMHPVIPFVTEVLWWKLNEVCPRRGLPGRIDCPGGKRLIRADWPAVGDVSQAAEHIFPKIQEVVTTIRNLRNDYKVDARKPVTVSILAPGEAGRQILALQPAIELLATCKLATVGPEVTPPASAVRAAVDKCEIYVEGLVDPAADAGRTAKLREELQRKIATLKGRLNNEGYLAKAPPKLVQETKDQLSAAEAELAKLG